MIFRKPYGFLIKHFRLVHLIITGILVYFVSCNNKIYEFINLCIDDSVNRYNALSYIDYNLYIWIGLAIGLFFIIYWLFKYKDKPRNIYILSILGYIVIGIYIFVLYSYFSGLPNGVIEQKTIRGYRDITLITLCFQYLIIIIMFVRGLGFDIKKFNFSKDIKDLDLSDEDEEEVEVDFNINTTTVFREVRKRRREFGYFLKEYKVFVIGIVFILLVILGMKVYNYFSEVLKVYQPGEFVGNINYVSIKNGYYNINDDKNYIIISLDIFKRGKEEKFDVNTLVLNMGDVDYLPNKNICYKFDSIGNCYKKQYINEIVRNYVVVYEVDSVNIEDSYLYYKESYDNSFKVKLKLENYE